MAEIPDKVYFKIGEVARLAELKPYVLRYWETEFGVLRPKKSRSGQRLYRRSDVEMVLRIKTLLKDRKFTIAGARAQLRKGKAASAAEDETDTVRVEPSAEAGSAPEAVADPALVTRVKAQDERVKAQDELLLHLRGELEQLRTFVRAQGRPD